MKDWFRKLLTESDNSTPDIVRLLATFTILTGLGLSVYNVVQGNAFNFQDFGIGAGATYAGLAAALGFKKETPMTTEN